jgi:hypothetical protein
MMKSQHSSTEHGGLEKRLRGVGRRGTRLKTDSEKKERVKIVGGSENFWKLAVICLCP